MNRLWNKYLKSNSMQSPNTKIFVLSILLVIVLLVRIMFFSYKQSTNLQDTVRFIQQSQDIRYNTQKLVSLMHDYERCIQNKKTFDTSVQHQIEDIKFQIQDKLTQLYPWVKNDKIQLSHVQKIKNVINQRINSSEKYNPINSSSDNSNYFFKQLNAFAYQIENEEANRIAVFKSGNDKTILTISIIFYILGGVVVLLLIGIVINVQKNSFERKANALLQEYSTLIDMSHDAIVTTDANSNILQWSKGAELLYGYTKEAVYGKHIAMFTKPLETEARIAVIQKEVYEKGSWRGEMRQQNSDGKELYLDVSYSLITNTDGTIKGFSSIRSNITELKKSKVNLQQLNTNLEIEIANKTKEITDIFERMQKAFLAFDTNWICIYANKPILAYLNTTHENIIGSKFDNFFEGITDTNFYKACLKALQTQQMQELKEYIPFFSCWFESSIYPSENGVSIYISDITDQKKVESELISQKRQLRNLSNHIQNLREEERKIIARELHDDLGQMATVLKIDVRNLKNNLINSSEKVNEKVQTILETVDELIQKIRKISHELRPTLLDNVGLQAALKNHCLEFEKKTGINCFFYNETANERLPQNIEIALFRICQEALTNVMRHAHATEVIVKLSIENNYIYLQISDNGNGFDINDNGNTLGLVGIRERAESIKINLTIESVVGNGTTITASGTITSINPNIHIL